MDAVLDWLTTLSSTVYGGVVLAFAVLLAVYPRTTGRPAAEIARVWRSCGPLLGLAMGALVLGLLGSRYLADGELAWGFDTAAARRDLAVWLVFAALWASSFVLEIWTMEPLRSAYDDRAGVVTDDARFHAGYRATSRHLALNALLFVVWMTLTE